MIVKVCGIKYQNNLIDLSNLPVDMVGLNFYKRSKRYISSSLNVESLSKDTAKVGVFVNEKSETIKNIIERYRLDFVQLHGDESPEQCLMLSKSIKVIKALSISNTLDLEKTKIYPMCSYFLFDTKTDDYGGSGRKFDWNILNAYTGNIKFILAGGIGPEDEQLLKNIIHPSFSGIDINSRFEVRPGEKNVDQVKSFVQKYKGLKTIK